MRHAPVILLCCLLQSVRNVNPHKWTKTTPPTAGNLNPPLMPPSLLDPTNPAGQNNHIYPDRSFLYNCFRSGNNNEKFLTAFCFNIIILLLLLFVSWKLLLQIIYFFTTPKWIVFLEKYYLLLFLDSKKSQNTNQTYNIFCLQPFWVTCRPAYI